MKTKVQMTTEESSPGVPLWGPNAVITELPEGQTQISLENLIAGKRYWIKTWNEDDFGNRSRELVLPYNTALPMREDKIQFSAQGVLDEGSPMYAYVKIDDDVKSVKTVRVTLAFRQFFAPSTSAASSGTLTSNTDGGTTTPSGGGSTSGSSSASTSDNASSHTHTWGGYVSDTPVGGTTTRRFSNPGGTANYNLPTTVGEALVTTADASHNHGIPHTHTTPSHTHSCPNHAHNVPGHTHALVYGTFEEAYPASHSVIVQVYKRVSNSWQFINAVSTTDDLADLNLYWINGPGDWRIAVISNTGQPNGGRLGCDLFGSLTLLSEVS